MRRTAKRVIAVNPGVHLNLLVLATSALSLMQPLHNMVGKDYMCKHTTPCQGHVPPQTFGGHSRHPSDVTHG